MDGIGVTRLLAPAAGFLDFFGRTECLRIDTRREVDEENIAWMIMELFNDSGLGLGEN